MPTARVVADGLFKGEVLLSPEQEQTAYRGIDVRAIAQDAPCDLDAGSQSDRIGGVPPRTDHRMIQFLLGSDETDVEGVAGDSLRREGRFGSAFKCGMVFVVPPEQG